MNVITPRRLREFWEKHPDAEGPLRAWEKLVRRVSPRSFEELKQTFGSADFVPPEFTVFDIGGNKYRLVASIAYQAGRVYVKHVLTHREYDEWSDENRRSRRKR